MNQETQNAGTIFGQALVLTVPAERSAYLDRVCACNQALHREVESLWRAHENAGAFLDRTVKLSKADFVIERPGTLIGRYKLLEQIGAGGFGVVWMT